MLRICSALVVAVVLGIGARDASAVTLFTNSAHTTQVSLGATAHLTGTSPFSVTSATGALTASCSQTNLPVTVHGTGGGTFFVTFWVSSSSFTGCSPSAVTGTFGLPWRITAMNPATVVGSTTRYPAVIDDVVLDLASFGQFSGHPLNTGVTALEPTVGTSPICVDLATGRLTGGVTLNGRFCLSGTPAQTWSLT